EVPGPVLSDGVARFVTMRALQVLPLARCTNPGTGRGSTNGTPRFVLLSRCESAAHLNCSNRGPRVPCTLSNRRPFIEADHYMAIDPRRMLPRFGYAFTITLTLGEVY